MRLEHLEALLAARDTKRAVVLVTDLATGKQQLIDPCGAVEDPELAEAAAEGLRRDSCLEIEREGQRLFVQPFNPPLRLIVVGAVHIAQSLSAMAAATGYEVWVVDPRSAFANEERFPGVSLSREWPDVALRELELDARSAVVTLSHDPKLDEPALCEALASPAFYIGALGSRRTHAARLERMAKLGFASDALARIHGPVGLDIGARSPAEIAVSILAQVTQSIRSRDS